LMRLPWITTPGAGDAVDGGGTIADNVFCGALSPVIFLVNLGDAAQSNNTVTTLGACPF
jgi:hypothetical protein